MWSFEHGAFWKTCWGFTASPMRRTGIASDVTANSELALEFQAFHLTNCSLTSNHRRVLHFVHHHVILPALLSSLSFFLNSCSCCTSPSSSMSGGRESSPRQQQPWPKQLNRCRHAQHQMSQLQQRGKRVLDEHDHWSASHQQWGVGWGCQSSCRELPWEAAWWSAMQAQVQWPLEVLPSHRRPQLPRTLQACQACQVSHWWVCWCWQWHWFRWWHLCCRKWRSGGKWEWRGWWWWGWQFGRTSFSHSPPPAHGWWHSCCWWWCSHCSSSFAAAPIVAPIAAAPAVAPVAAAPIVAPVAAPAQVLPQLQAQHPLLPAGIPAAPCPLHTMTPRTKRPKTDPSGDIMQMMQMQILANMQEAESEHQQCLDQEP